MIEPQGVYSVVSHKDDLEIEWSLIRRPLGKVTLNVLRSSVRIDGYVRRYKEKELRLVFPQAVILRPSFFLCHFRSCQEPGF